jgi:hypothetical protein
LRERIADLPIREGFGFPAATQSVATEIECHRVRVLANRLREAGECTGNGERDREDPPAE